MRSPEDPVDHVRTTRPHAGESMKDTKNLPALVLLGLALVAFVACLAAFATAHQDVGLTLAVVAAVVFVVSVSWFALEHRRVRRIEERWYAEHPEVARQKPTS